MRILVTGNNGFIGQHIVPLVKEVGKVVTCSSQDCDLLDEKSVTLMLRKVSPTHCLHLAWYTQVDYANSRKNIDWLVAGQHLIREFYANGGVRFVGIGTCFEYALPGDCYLDETSATLPHTLYGKCKLALGAYLKNIAEKNRASWAWCRPFFITGPGESQRRLIPAACNALIHNKDFYSKSYHRILDYMDVRDVADAISKVLCSDFQGIINIASGTGQVVGELLTMLAEHVNNGHSIKATEQSYCEKNIIANVNILKSIIKFYPQYTLQETLLACLEDIRSRV